MDPISFRVMCVRFLVEVYSHADTIDPNDERDWYDLALGFLLACNVPLEMAEGEPCMSLACGQLPEVLR